MRDGGWGEFGFCWIERELHHDRYPRDPAIEGFLTLLEKGIASGQQVSTLPQALAEAMLAAIQQPVDLGKF